MTRPDHDRSDARDESLTATDLDPTGTAPQDTSATDREHEGDEEEASPT